MKKVIVFDSGWGGEMVADFIEEEIGVVEVVRVIDWRHAPYINRGEKEIVRLIEEALSPYWGRANAIVLGGFVASGVRGELRSRHPDEVFVALDFTEVKTKMRRFRRALVLADGKTTEGATCQELIKKLRADGKEVAVANCQGWTELIDEGEMTKEFLGENLKPIDPETVDVVVIGNTHFWDIEDDLRKVLRWQVLIYDYRHELAYDLCGVLGLKGRSGRHMKY